MKNNKKVLKIVFIILLVLVLLVNVSYALFSFVLRGTKENSISTANVSLNYTESTNGINTTNPTVMSDAEGIVNGASTTFTIGASSNKAREVPYYIYLSLDKGNIIDNSNVRFYLEDTSNSKTFGPKAVSNLEVKDINNREYYLYSNSFSLTAQSLNQTHSYTLKVWIKNNLTSGITTTTEGKEQTTEIGRGKYSFKINVETGEHITFDYQEFAYNGTYQVFTVPTTGYYQVELWGAQGGTSSDKLTLARGGYSSGIIFLTKAEKLYVYVGSSGTSGYYNGGGPGGALSSQGYNGGGATDIRYFSSIPTSSELLYNSSLGINSRIMVAGGGGGIGGNAYSNAGTGAGGGLIAAGGTYYSGHGDVSQYGKGGAQEQYDNQGLGIYSGASTNKGYFGFGGVGSGTSSYIGVGGGGGGYYGGGAGGNTLSGGSGNGGGGGSSFISGYAGSNAIASSTDTANPRTHSNNTLHYSNKYFLNGSMVEGINTENGKAKISYMGIAYNKTSAKLNNVRYIKDCTNGSSGNSGNHWVELQAIKEGINLAKGKTVTGTSTEANSTTFSYNYIVDGMINNITGNSGFGYPSLGGLQCITVDLTAIYNLDEIAVWHYYKDGRSYSNHSLYVSSDNNGWTVLIDNVSDTAETSNGIRINAYE